MPKPLDLIAERLAQLGFSQYEARTYVGLLISGDATGYSVANATGVPQPKVYETLRRLVERGAAVQTGHRPARYAAVPPDQVLAGLERDFEARLGAARRDLEELPRAPAPPSAFPGESFAGFERAVELAAGAIGEATTHVYLHGREDELRPLAEAVAGASARGVPFVIVHFGPLPFPAPRGRAVRHASTEGTLYASRRARHLAVVADSRRSVWALARDGQHWEGVHSGAPLLASLVKTYIRHDLFVQRMYADLPEALEAEYGPGLHRLADVSSTPDEAERAV